MQNSVSSPTKKSNSSVAKGGYGNGADLRSEDSTDNDNASMGSKSSSSKSETGVSAKPKSGTDQSIIEMVKNQLPSEAQETFEVASKQLTTFISNARSYISENPREALLVGASVALGSWAMLKTAPGKKAFNSASIAFMPRLSEWFSKTFSRNQNKVH